MTTPRASDPKNRLMGCAPVQLLITDLDNTLYDWVRFFAKAFRAMVDEAVLLMEVDREQLLDELRRVHRAYGDSERPFSLLDTPSAQNRWPQRSERQRQLDSAFHAFNRVRKAELTLYTGVLETLNVVSRAGVPIIAHTEATSINAVTRLNYLQIPHLFTQLYAAKSAMPVTREHGFELVEVDRAIHKPDPRILRQICSRFSVQPSRALYVGDSLSRDIAMAKRAGMRSAWAKYGTSHDPEDWAMLVRITHWTEEDVARVEDARRRWGHVVPDVELEKFESIKEHFRL